MARLTLRIPDSLHSQLRARAKREGVSMNQGARRRATRILVHPFSFIEATVKTCQQHYVKSFTGM